MSTTKNRRHLRNILINPRFQLRLAFIHTAFVVLVLLVLVVALLSPFYFDIHGSDELEWRYATAQLLLHLLDRLGIVVLLVIVISAIYHVTFSHRLCGPLVNFGHTLNAMKTGDFRRKVFLRRKDYLQEEAKKINDVISALSERIGALKTNHARLMSVAGQLSDGDQEDRLRRLLQEEKALLDRWIVESAEETEEGH